LGCPVADCTPSADVISEVGSNEHGSPTSGVGTTLADAELPDGVALVAAAVVGSADGIEDDGADETAVVVAFPCEAAFSCLLA